MSMCACRFEVMMFSVTVRINIQKIKVVNLEFAYELRRIQLHFLHLASSLQIIISMCQTNYSWEPSGLLLLLNTKCSTSPTRNTLSEYILDEMQPVHADISCFLLRQITAYYLHMSVAVSPAIPFEEECDIYKCVSITRWFCGACYALLALSTLHQIPDCSCEC